MNTSSIRITQMTESGKSVTLVMQESFYSALTEKRFIISGLTIPGSSHRKKNASFMKRSHSGQNSLRTEVKAKMNQINDKELKSLSKFIALIRRHKPGIIGITLDKHGWADTDRLIEGVNRHGDHHITMDVLEETVKTDDKQRYSISDDKKRIRANQGHMIPVDVGMEEKEPPRVLYHGTGEKYTASIDKQGLLPKSRLYVHLSKDIETANKVGMRHGKPVIYEVKADEMYRDGGKFYLSANGVWQTKTVPVRYLHKITL